MNKWGQKKETGIKFICKYIWLFFCLPSSVEIWDYHMDRDKMFCFLFTDEFVVSSFLDLWLLAFDVLVFDWVVFDRVLWNVLWMCVVCQSYLPQVAVVLPLALRVVFLCLLTNVPQTLVLKFRGLCVTVADDWTGGQLRFLGQGLIAACRRRGEIQTAL